MHLRKAFLLGAIGISLNVHPTSAAEVVIIEEDFESEIEQIFFANNSSTLTIVDDPEVDGTRGKVGVFDMAGGDQWGGLDPTPLRYPLLPLGIAPGTDTFTYTADFYIPSDTTLSGDRAGLRIRWTDENETGKNEIANNPGTDGLPRDQWFELQMLSGTIPATFGDSQTVTHVRPMFTVQDVDPDAPAGIAAYVDNIRMTATTGDEDPNIVPPSASPFGSLSPGGVITRNLLVSNTGLTQDLVISGATIGGDEAANYAVTTVFPLTITPGTSGNIEVTFDSSTGAGPYSATLTITSNDVIDPMVTASLDALIVDPTGQELIINGGFETGNTLGFAANSSFAVVDEPARTGDHAAVFTLAGGNEWGAVALDQPAPPGVEGQPSQIAITPEMIGQPYKFSCWYLRPETDGIADDDLVQFILRWNGIMPDSGPFISLSGGGLGFDTWVEYVEEGTVPATWPEDGGAETTSVFPIFSYRDVNANAVGTERVYVDDMSFVIDVPDPPEPEVPFEIIAFDYTRDGNAVTLTWTSSPDRSYRVEYSSDLLFWSDEEDTVGGTPDSEMTSWTFQPTGDGRRYYRIIRNPPPPE